MSYLAVRHLGDRCRRKAVGLPSSFAAPESNRAYVVCCGGGRGCADGLRGVGGAGGPP